MTKNVAHNGQTNIPIVVFWKPFDSVDLGTDILEVYNFFKVWLCDILSHIYSKLWSRTSVLSTFECIDKQAMRDFSFKKHLSVEKNGILSKGVCQYHIKEIIDTSLRKKNSTK